jgi:hypothetical protein
MTKQDRTTLRSYFRDGALPTAEHFRDLIDSGVNQVEDGFSKSPTDGLMLTSVGSSLRLMSLYQGLGTTDPSWVLEHGTVAGGIHLRQGPGLGEAAQDGGPPPAHSGLSISRDGRIGVHNEAPDWRLDVDGVARMTGRIGAASAEVPHVPANAGWYDITPSITGCQILEVVAGVGGERNEGRYSLLHAVAMNAYHPRNPLLNWMFRRRPIKAQTAVYGSYADRLRLRWVAARERHHFRLQLRSNASFGEGKVIRYYITRLWFDSTMSGSRGGPDRDGDVT